MKHILLIIVCSFFFINAISQETSKSFYDFSAISLNGQKIEMSTYKGKVILVVNTASKCGLTPQYKDLEALYKKYQDQGFVVLGFPCNQFLKQEPGTSKEIAEFCKKNYGVTFPMFEKIKVNGQNAHPIYKYLKSIFPGRIAWNFGKFLIDKDGNPVKRFSPKTKPFDLEDSIKKIL